jgi:hypothetical protein
MREDSGLKLKYINTKNQVADMFTKSVFTSLQLTKLMFLLGIAQSKVSHVIHEHVPSIKKGNACNVSCIERHVGCGGTRVLQVLQGAGFMLDKKQENVDECTSRLSNIHFTLLEAAAATSEVYERLDELDEFDGGARSSRVTNTSSHDSEPLNIFEPFAHEFEATSKNKRISSANQNIPLHFAERSNGSTEQVMN